MLAVVFIVFFFAAPCHALWAELHSTMAYEAALAVGVPTELAVYSGDPEDCINNYKDTMCEGAYDEDADRDPRTSPFAWSGFFNWGSHFWQPDRGPDGGLLSNAGGLQINLEAQNAYQRAYMLYSSAKTVYNENPSYAYYLLGRVEHLLTDMATPAHVHLDPHFSDITGLGDDSFEAYTGSRYVSQDRQTGISAFETEFPASGIAPIDYKNLPDYGYAEEPLLFRLFYSMANISKTFDSDDADGTADNGVRRGKSISTSISSPYQVYALRSGYPDELLQNGYDISLSRNKFVMLNSAIEALKNADPAYEGIRLDFNEGSEMHSLEDFKKTDIGDTDTAQVSDILLPAGLRHIAALYQFFWAETHPNIGDSPPVIVLNNNTHRINITRPAPIDLLIDIDSNSWAENMLEVYVWLEASLNSSRLRFYFVGSWQPADSVNEIRPLVHSVSLSQVKGLVWRMLDDTSLLPDMNFNINLCMDKANDGIYTPAESICNSVLISIR